MDNKNVQIIHGYSELASTIGIDPAKMKKPNP